MYQSVDPVKTGLKLKILLNGAGYNVKDIQEYLLLAYPQSIYRWFSGKILPSVDHLCALSRLLDVHMENLLVLQGQSLEDEMVVRMEDIKTKRLLSYRKYLRESA